MKKILFSLGGFLFFVPAAVLAADSGCSGFEAIFGSLSGQSGNPTEGLPKICTAAGAISWATNLGLAFAGVIAVVFIIVGGYMYLTSGGNEEAAEKGRKVLTNSIIGLLIIILAATIVRIIVNTLDTGRGDTPNVTSTITYGGATTTPGGAGGGGGLSQQDKATLLDGFSVSTNGVDFSLPKTSDSAIKTACGIQNIGNNVSVSAKVGNTELGRSGLTLSGNNYVGGFSIQPGTFDPATDTVIVYVCGVMVGSFTP